MTAPTDEPQVTKADLTDRPIPKALIDKRQRVAATLAAVWIALLPVQIPLAGISGREVNIAPSDFVLVAAVVIGLSSFRIRKGLWSLWHFALPALLFLNLLLFGVFTRYSLINKSIGMLLLVGAYALMTSVAVKLDAIRHFIRVFVASVAIINLVALVVFLTGFQVPLIGCVGSCIRFQGFLPDPNLYGSLLVVAIAFVISNSGAGRFFVSRHVDWVLHLGLLLGLVLTLSRSAWISAIVVFAIGAFLMKGPVVRWIVAGGAIITGLVYLLVGDQLADLVVVANRTGTIDSRFVLIDQGLEQFALAPFTGIGLGRFPEIYGQIIHNTPLWIAVELGLVGLLVFVGFFGWVMRKSIIAYRLASPQSRSLAAGLIMGHAAMFMFSMSVEAFYQRHWWFLFAMTASAHHAISQIASRDA